MTQALLNYKQIGQGAHIVLIHGLFGSLENLNMVAKELAQHFTVTSVDVRNHGGSFHQSSMAYNDLAQDVIKLIDYLAIDRCHFLGHSMGGKLVMQLAIIHNDRCNKLIIADVAPVTYPPHHAMIIAGLKAIELTSLTKRSDADLQLAHYVNDKGVRQFLLRNLVKQDDHFIFKCNLAFIEQGYEQISSGIGGNNSFSPSDERTIKQAPVSEQKFLGEVLFIKGGNSDYILPEHRSAIANILPNSKLKIIQGTGHWLHAEKTAAFNRTVLNFLLP